MKYSIMPERHVVTADSRLACDSRWIWGARTSLGDVETRDWYKFPELSKKVFKSLKFYTGQFNNASLDDAYQWQFSERNSVILAIDINVVNSSTDTGDENHRDAYMAGAKSNSYNAVIPNSGSYDDFLRLASGKYIKIRFPYPHNAVLFDLIRLDVEADDIYPRITPTYPINISSKQANDLIFTWSYDAGAVPLRGTQLAQKTVSIAITQNGTTRNYSADTSNNYLLIPANTLAVGEATYKITVTNEDDKSYTTEPISFTVTGNTSTSITGVSRTAVPTVTWASDHQDGYQVQIWSPDRMIYDTGLKVGSDVRSAVLPVILDNGSYNVRVRTLNIYGYYSDWDTYSYTLSADGGTVPTGVTINENSYHGVSVSCEQTENVYVVRRDPAGKTEVVGTYSAGFEDYTQRGNVDYSYAVRIVDGGYTDSEYIHIRIDVDGVVLHDGRNPKNAITLKYSDRSFDVVSGDSRTRSLVQCLGRVYPVKEETEWITETRTFNAYVSESDVDRLKEMIINSPVIYYKADREFFPVDVEYADSGKYVAGGRIFSFTLTRISVDEGAKIWA